MSERSQPALPDCVWVDPDPRCYADVKWGETYIFSANPYTPPPPEYPLTIKTQTIAYC
jgi:hypothetical protein